VSNNPLGYSEYKSGDADNYVEGRDKNGNRNRLISLNLADTFFSSTQLLTIMSGKD